MSEGRILMGLGQETQIEGTSGGGPARLVITSLVSNSSYIINTSYVYGASMAELKQHLLDLAADCDTVETSDDGSPQ